MAGSFVNIDDIHIDLIDQVNPFQKAFEILSKSAKTPNTQPDRRTPVWNGQTVERRLSLACERQGESGR